MLKILLILFILNFYNPVFSSTKENLISQIQITNTLSFDFIQTIDDKNQNGKCVIKYPKRIWCEYSGFNKKIIVSDGESLVIKTIETGGYYRYPLSKTPLIFLLDKEYLISKLNILKPRKIDNKYLNFTFFENNNEINIFFDKKNLNLVGWQTEDVYQNLVITFISSVKRNIKINNKIFILPKIN
jgi:outer membrane lipoprotein-sorting protein